MAFTPTSDDFDALDKFLGRVSELAQSGRASQVTARAMMRHVIACAASDSQAEFQGYIRLSSSGLLGRDG